MSDHSGKPKPQQDLHRGSALDNIGILHQSNMIPIGNDKAQDTEDAARRYRGLDTWRTAEILQALWSSQSSAVAACLAALPALQRAVDGAVEQLGSGAGRLVYAGAGSSGMIAAVDALDLGPTFNWPEERTLVFVAGGRSCARSSARSCGSHPRARARSWFR